MTLFKRVFNNHITGKTPVPVPSHQVEEPEIELQFDDEIVTDIAAVVGEEKADAFTSLGGQPGTSGNSVYTSHIPPRPTAEIVAQPYEEPNSRDPIPAELDPEMAAYPGTVERAEQAHKKIEETQKQVGLKVASHLPDEAVATQAPPGNANQSDDAVEPETLARPGRGARRVRTRMLGFDQGIDAAADPFENQKHVASAPVQKFPVGWMVVVAGQGKGHSFAIYNGVSTIGRGIDQTVALDFGDSSVSREKHAAIAYDDENKSFFLGHGGKSNIVRLNDRPVLCTEDLSHGDTVRIGETTLRFIALCGAEFAWGKLCNDET